MSQYRVEIETLRRMIAQSERLVSRLGDEVARLRIELSAPLRVSLLDQPTARRGR